ncbi:MAG: CPBP family intramembrane glutamic endopeptidase [Pirellulales bacterium]
MKQGSDIPADSRWRRVVRGYGQLVLAVVVGALLSTPALLRRVQGYSHVTYLIADAPPDDQPLVAWGQAQPGVELFQVERPAEGLRVYWQFRGIRPQPNMQELSQALRDRGYGIRGIQGGGSGLAGGLGDLVSDPLTMAMVLGGTQLAFLVIGSYHGWRSARRSGRAFGSGGGVAQATAAGLAGGLALLAINVLYGLGMEWWRGASAPSPWNQSPFLSPTGKAVFLLFGALGAPLAEEVFFRGYLLGMFRQAKDVGFGILFSSLLFAVLHIADPYHLPATFLFGLILAWLTCRTDSLWAAIVAHAVNNGVAILVLTRGGT